MHTTARSPSSGRIWTHRQIMVTLGVWCHSSSNRVVTVTEVMHSHSNSMSCQDRLITSVAKKTPTALGGREVDCSLCTFGV